jgi:hypothetical protein
MTIFENHKGQLRIKEELFENLLKQGYSYDDIDYVIESLGYRQLSEASLRDIISGLGSKINKIKRDFVSKNINIDDLTNQAIEILKKEKGIDLSKHREKLVSLLVPSSEMDARYLDPNVLPDHIADEIAQEDSEIISKFPNQKLPKGATISGELAPGPDETFTHLTRNVDTENLDLKTNIKRLKQQIPHELVHFSDKVERPEVFDADGGVHYSEKDTENRARDAEALGDRLNLKLMKNFLKNTFKKK